ncbi:hypothetical protein CHUAL_004171 [Chamberlinius hualienensis]
MADGRNGESSQSSNTTEKMSNKSREKEAVLDDDSGITMVDVLENEKELDEDANAVLGGSDDQNCTYPTGYVKRQALYACGTCLENNAGKNKSPAGICLACSFSCHEGHRLFELYTKRNFRCDCGNSKFKSNPCKLFPDKEPLNVSNNYNQNFDGLYCTCARPYPDPDDEIEDEMIQCIICEDWYHGRHLGAAVPDNNEYGEMVCGSCIDKCEFLWGYQARISESREDVDEGVVTASSSVNDESGRVDVEKVTPHCVWKDLENKTTKRATGAAAFMPDGWRSKLCLCSNCREKYVEKNIMFLLDSDDTVHFYEEQGKAKNCSRSTYDQGMQALSQLDRIKQVEAISGYNDMKVELLDFLKDFAQRKKVVRKEDIDEFFSQMKAKKRRVDVTIPQFCR